MTHWVTLTGMTTAVDRLIKAAAREVGYHEGRDKSGHWNNREKYAETVPGLEWADGQPWCDTFVHAMAKKAGLLKLWPKPSASCDITAAGWKAKGCWSEFPAIGAQVFYGAVRDLVHTGIVIGFDATYIYTIEGNTNANGSREGDGVYRKTRKRRDKYVVGYGYPQFPEGIHSADPRYRKGHRA